MIRKIVNSSTVQQTEYSGLNETKPDQSRVDTQQLNQNINPIESQKSSASIAAERKFTGSITETIVRSTLENQLQSNYAQSNDTLAPANSGAQDITDTLSRMQDEYKKQQAEKKETAKLWTQVKPEIDPATDAMNKISLGTETMKVDQKVPVVGVNQIGRLSNEPLPSAPVNSGAQDIADTLSRMQDEYKKHQAQKKETARLWAGVKPENDSEKDAINKILFGTETTKVDQNASIIDVNEVGAVSSEPLPSFPVNSGAQDIADTLSQMQDEYKKQQEDQKRAAALLSAIVNQDHPNE